MVAFAAFGVGLVVGVLIGFLARRRRFRLHIESNGD